MSTVKANNVQVGQSGTATNNFTLYQPSSPDGTVRLAVGNSGATSADVLTANNSGTLILQGGSTSATGVGITFPATQSASSNANTLDDYEEGTWTPTITCGTPGTLSVTYTTQTGSYTKIGRLVTANFLLTFNITKGTAAGDASIGGLPFSISGASDRFSGAIGFVNNLGTANIIGLLGGGGTTSSLIGAINGSTLGITAITDGNSRSIRGTLSYEI